MQKLYWQWEMLGKLFTIISLAFVQYSIKHSYHLKFFTKFLVEGVHVGDGWSLRHVIFLIPEWSLIKCTFAISRQVFELTIVCTQVTCGPQVKIQNAFKLLFWLNRTIRMFLKH